MRNRFFSNGTVRRGSLKILTSCVLFQSSPPDVRYPDVPGQGDPSDEAHPVPGAALSGRAGGSDQGDRAQEPLERRPGWLHHRRRHRCLPGEREREREEKKKKKRWLERVQF